MSYRIGIDIGGTTAKLGVVAPDGSITARASLATGRTITGRQLVSGLAERVAGLQGAHRALALGVAAPGFRRDDGEGVVNVGNLPKIDGFGLRRALEMATGLPTTLDNDANAAALGESRHGAGQGVARLLVITLGTGIGAGMVVDGAVHRICAQGLGDPGHVIVRPNGPQCTCGGYGCMEAVASVPMIVRRASEAAGSAYTDFGGVAMAARQGDRPAEVALSEAAADLGVGLTTLVHLLGPQRVLLGGGGMEVAGDLLLPRVRSALMAHLQPYFASRLTLDLAGLGNDAGVIGAASLAA